MGMRSAWASWLYAGRGGVRGEEVGGGSSPGSRAAVWRQHPKVAPRHVLQMQSEGKSLSSTLIPSWSTLHSNQALACTSRAGRHALLPQPPTLQAGLSGACALT